MRVMRRFFLLIYEWSSICKNFISTNYFHENLEIFNYFKNFLADDFSPEVFPFSLYKKATNGIFIRNESKD